MNDALDRFTFLRSGNRDVHSMSDEVCGLGEIAVERVREKK